MCMTWLHRAIWRKDKLMPSLLSNDIPLPYGRRRDVRRAKPTPFRALTPVDVWALTSEKEGRQITNMTTREDKERDGNCHCGKWLNSIFFVSIAKGLTNFWQGKNEIALKKGKSTHKISIRTSTVTHSPRSKSRWSVPILSTSFFFCGPTKNLTTFWLWTMTWLDFSRIPRVTTCCKKWSRGILEVPQPKKNRKTKKKIIPWQLCAGGVIDATGQE